MKNARLELRIDRVLMERVDAARGDVSRTRWVERALEAALEVEPPYRVPSPERASARVPREIRGREVVEPAADWAWERQQRLNRNRK
jgi:hypothetical protein